MHMYLILDRPKLGELRQICSTIERPRRERPIWPSSLALPVEMPTVLKFSINAMATNSVRRIAVVAPRMCFTLFVSFFSFRPSFSRANSR